MKRNKLNFRQEPRAVIHNADAKVRRPPRGGLSRI
jgi:hypothetical protein